MKNIIQSKIWKELLKHNPAVIIPSKYHTIPHLRYLGVVRQKSLIGTCNCYVWRGRARNKDFEIRVCHENGMIGGAIGRPEWFDNCYLPLYTTYKISIEEIVCHIINNYLKYC